MTDVTPRIIGPIIAKILFLPPPLPPHLLVLLKDRPKKFVKINATRALFAVLLVAKTILLLPKTSTFAALLLMLIIVLLATLSILVVVAGLLITSIILKLVDLIMPVTIPAPFLATFGGTVAVVQASRAFNTLLSRLPNTSIISAVFTQLIITLLPIISEGQAVLVIGSPLLLKIDKITPVAFKLILIPNPFPQLPYSPLPTKAEKLLNTRP